MASNAKTVLVFMLLLATVMAAQAKKVSVKNKYCKPITVNGVVIEADGEVDVDVDAVKSIELDIDVEQIEVFVRDLFGGDSTGDYSLPSDVTKVEIVQNAQGLVAKVLDAATTMVDSLLDGIIVNVNLEICINL